MSLYFRIFSSNKIKPNVDVTNGDTEETGTTSEARDFSTPTLTAIVPIN